MRCRRRPIRRTGFVRHECSAGALGRRHHVGGPAAPGLAPRPRPPRQGDRRAAGRTRGDRPDAAPVRLAPVAACGERGGERVGSAGPARAGPPFAGAERAADHWNRDLRAAAGRSAGRGGGAARAAPLRPARCTALGEADAARFRALGAARVEVRGNLKFAAPPLPADMAEVVRLRALLAGRPCWVAASTHPGEEAIVIAAHRALAARCAGLLTILVPRHPERGAEVAVLAGNLPMRRRALGEAPPETGGVWIADTLGELGLWYRLAPVALVGRSLVPPGGGQNPLEPVRLGCVVASGPLMGNFAEAAAALEAAGALARVRDGAELARFVAAMLDDPARRAVAAEAGRAAIARYAELPGATADALLELLD